MKRRSGIESAFDVVIVFNVLPNTLDQVALDERAREVCAKLGLNPIISLVGEPVELREGRELRSAFDPRENEVFRNLLFARQRRIDIGVEVFHGVTTSETNSKRVNPRFQSSRQPLC